jgi:hypothetical protein
MKYNKDERIINENKELGEFFRDFSINNNNGKDYVGFVSLNYHSIVKSDGRSRVVLKNLKKFLEKKYIKINGVYVNEYSLEGRIHNHCLIYSNVSFGNFKKELFNYWRKVGSVRCDRYDSEKNGYMYLVKHINKLRFNNWDLIDNL